MAIRGNRNLDILRAIAVCSVLLAHCIPYAASGNQGTGAKIQAYLGRYGVLLFFVHTACVLLMSLSRDTSSSWVTRFYARRIFRIYPLSILCVVAALVFRIPPVHGKPFAWPSSLNLAANVTLTQNLFHGSSLTDSSLSGPMWSLPYEIQMYFVLPLLFVLVSGGHLRRNVLLMVISSVALTIAEKLLFPNGPWLTQFFPCFTGGIIAYSLIDKPGTTPAAVWPLSIAVIGVLYFIADASHLAQWAACLLLGSVLFTFREAPENAFSRACRIIAKYSYGIYLAHMPLHWLCFEVLQIPTAARWLAYGALVSLVPAALYHSVENPMIRLGRECFLAAEPGNRRHCVGTAPFCGTRGW